jgi:hypothetical protein
MENSRRARAPLLEIDTSPVPRTLENIVMSSDYDFCGFGKSPRLGNKADGNEDVYRYA